MAKIVVHQIELTDANEIISICPFGAIEYRDGKIDINAACKVCKICVKKRPDIFEFEEGEKVEIDKNQWRGVTVYVDHNRGEIHPVTFELIAKARELADKINHPVYCVFAGNNITDKAQEVLHYGADEVFVYDYPELEYFRIEPYTAVLEDFINRNKPTIMLFGGTTVGRSLAPRTAARFRTGLTADCTKLDVQENTDLSQIRPAFGGNIMAHIYTPNHRPQFATVRYKIFSSLERNANFNGKVHICELEKGDLASKINVLEVKNKEKVQNLEDAEVIIVAGKAFKREEDLKMIHELAEKLGARVAATRPLIEAGWADPKTQIGLSGRTVKPKLIITCGVAGSVQFVAGMSGSECIISINIDPKASIFNVAHYAIVGDVYEVIPQLIENIDVIKDKLSVAEELA